MKLIITEQQLKMIIENEEYINNIKRLIDSFSPENIDIAFQIMKGMKIKQSAILDEYKELFDIFGLKPSKLNLIKIANRKEFSTKNNSSVPDILFKIPNLKDITIEAENLDNLYSFDGDLEIKIKGRVIPNLTHVGNNLIVYGGIESLPKLEYVGGYLYLRGTPIESLPMLSKVGGYLDLTKTPLSKTTTEKELRKQINVGGKIYL